MEAKKLETTSIKKRSYKDLATCFTSYVHCKSIKILSLLHFYELIEKIEDHEGKNYLMVDDYKPGNLLHKVLNKIKEIIDIKKFMILRFWLTHMINCQMILL